jgi:hypothetical protein
VEAAHRHDGATGGDDERGGELRARRGQQEALAVVVSFDSGRQAAFSQPHSHLVLEMKEQSSN